MSINLYTYIGPYLRATEIVEVKTVDLCKGHNFPDSALFCPKCGNSRNSRYSEIKYSNAPKNWEEDYIKDDKTFNDFLFSTSITSSPSVITKNDKKFRTYIYLPNCYYEGFEPIEQFSKGESEIPLNNVDMQKAMTTFIAFFENEINYIKQWFEIEIKFGCVSYYA